MARVVSGQLRRNGRIRQQQFHYIDMKQNQIPPNHIWISVYDLPSAISALNLLLEYIRNFVGDQGSSDADEI